MPIDKDTLDSLARSYARTMTSTRGKRVYRLLMREFSRFDHVLPALAEDDIGALLALSDAGGAAICRTDGRGSSVAIAEWIRLAEATVTTSYDLTKDSLPIVSWTIWHPSFARVVGTLTIFGGSLIAFRSKPHCGHPPKAAPNSAGWLGLVRVRSANR
jgi:hypothetical protein